MDIKKQIGLKYKNRRKQSKMSQKELAAIIQVRYATISDIENGKTNVSFDTLVKMAEVLECSIEFELKVKK